MSTRIEELPDSEDEMELQQYAVEYETESDNNDEIEIPEFKTLDHPPQSPQQKEQEQDSINNRIIQMLYSKLKEPVLVTFLMLLLTHPILIKGIFRIPYIEVMDSTISVNVMLSILAGILFFIIREFI